MNILIMKRMRKMDNLRNLQTFVFTCILICTVHITVYIKNCLYSSRVNYLKPFDKRNICYSTICTEHVK